MEVKKTGRYYLWLIKAFVKKHYPIIITGFAVGFLISTLLSTFQLHLPEIQKKKMIAVVGTYDISTLPVFLQKKMSRGLTIVESNGEIVGDLASDFKIEDNGKKYTFKLKQGIKWQDGKKFTSLNVNYNFKDVKIETPDDLTIIYSLKESFAPFPSLTTQPIFRPGLMGLGKYQLVSIKRSNKRIEFLTLKEIETSKETVYKFYPSETAAITAFKLGEVNSIYEIKDKERIANLKNTKITPTVDKNFFTAIFFNLKDQSLQEKSLRQALAYAVKEEIKGENRALSSFNSDSWVYNANVKEYNYDVKNAVKLLGKNQNASPSSELTLTLTTIDIYKSIAQKIAESWKDLKIKIEIEVVKSRPENYQLLLASSAIPFDPDQYLIWHSTQNTNITEYQSPKVDKLLEEGRKETDKAKRKQIYLDLQKALLEDLPAIFLFYPTTYSVERI